MNYIIDNQGTPVLKKGLLYVNGREKAVETIVPKGKIEMDGIDFTAFWKQRYRSIISQQQ